MNHGNHHPFDDLKMLTVFDSISYSYSIMIMNLHCGIDSDLPASGVEHCGPCHAVCHWRGAVYQRGIPWHSHSSSAACLQLSWSYHGCPLWPSSGAGCTIRWREPKVYLSFGALDTWFTLHPSFWVFSCSSLLVCMHFGAWDNSKEWSLPMPENENIEVVHWCQYFGCSLNKIPILILLMFLSGRLYWRGLAGCGH